MDSYKKIIGLMERHESWRSSCLNMIASENVTSNAVRMGVASDFGHRYAEGLLGGCDDGRKLFNRFYQGTAVFDEVEGMAMSMAEKMFDAEHANMVPISGALANLTAYYALAKIGDKISGLNIECGGHISHTHVSAAGVMGLKDVAYPFDIEEMNIDVDEAKKMVLREKPKIMIFGASVFLFPHPLKEMREAADEIGAVMMYDAAHVAGLIAGGKFQKHFKEGADVMTSSTHKSFPGPQGGMILCKNKFAKKIDNAAFPGLMSNHHLHHVAGFVVALAEMEKFGAEYASQILKNAKALAQSMHELGFDVLCEHKGFTLSHQVLVDISKNGGGRKVANDLEAANIILNKNMLPRDSLDKTGDPSGIRIGVQELTHVGMKESEMKEVAQLIKRVVLGGESPGKVKRDVGELKSGFSKVCYCFD